MKSPLPNSKTPTRIRDLSSTDSKPKKKQCGWMATLCDWFRQLGVLKKIILIFTLNTLLLLIIINIVMMVIFNNTIHDIIDIAEQDKIQFNIVSNQNVAQATAKRLLSGGDRHGQMFVQLIKTYQYFQNHPHFYSSLESPSPANPKLTSDYPNATYTEVGLYYLNNQSTFTPLPYLDQVLARLLQPAQLQAYIKRITVFVVNDTNSEDITARTVPAIDTFTIPSASTVIERFNSIAQGTAVSILPYIDVLTTQTNPMELTSFRTVLSGNGYQLYMQIEMLRLAYRGLQQTFYFSSAQIIIVNEVNSSYVITSYLQQPLLSAVSTYYPIGVHYFTLNSTTYWASSVGFNDTFILGQISPFTNSSQDPSRCIIVVEAEQTGQPADTISTFLNFELLVLALVVVFWSLIILMSTLALSAVVGNHIFSNLQTLCHKLQEYIKKPHQFHQILIELKELSLKGILKQLSDSLLAIIQKIQVRKRERKDRISQFVNSLGMGDQRFQQRQQLPDYRIIEQLERQAHTIVEEVRRKKEIAAEKRKKQQERKKEQEERKREAERLETLRLQIKQEDSDSEDEEEEDKLLEPPDDDTPDEWKDANIKISPPMWPPTPRQELPHSSPRNKSLSLYPPPDLLKNPDEEEPFDFSRAVTPTTLQILESLNRIPIPEEQNQSQARQQRDNSAGRMFKKKKQPYRKSK